MADKKPEGSFAVGRKLTRLEAERQTAHERFKLWMAGITAFTVIGVVLSMSVPLYVTKMAIEALAGKDTKICASMATMVAAMVGGGSAVAVIVTTFIKMRLQKSEVVRLRERVGELETRLREQRRHD